MSHWRMNGRLFGMSIMVSLTVVTVASGQWPPRPIPEGVDAKDRFLKLLDRPRVPLDAKEAPVPGEKGFVNLRFEFSSEKDQRVPGLLVSLESEPVRKPCVIALHGTGGSKEGMRLVLRRLAKAGFVAVAIDGRYSGERSGDGKGGESYRSAILDTWKTGEGFPFLYDTVWDVARLIDYLQTRSDVDPTRIGAIGFSKGGMELYLAAAVDPRIAVSVPCIGVQSFGWALDNNAWKPRINTIQSAVDSAAKLAAVDPIDSAFIRRFYERVVPGIHAEFDAPRMLPLIAPRPLLIINGDRDERTPRPGLELCIDAARQAYAQASATDHFEFMLQSKTGHAMTSKAEEQAFAWLVKHLRPNEKSDE